MRLLWIQSCTRKGSLRLRHFSNHSSRLQNAFDSHRDGQAHHSIPYEIYRKIQNPETLTPEKILQLFEKLIYLKTFKNFVWDPLNSRHFQLLLKSYEKKLFEFQSIQVYHSVLSLDKLNLPWTRQLHARILYRLIYAFHELELNQVMKMIHVLYPLHGDPRNVEPYLFYALEKKFDDHFQTNLKASTAIDATFSAILYFKNPLIRENCQVYRSAIVLEWLHYHLSKLNQKKKINLLEVYTECEEATHLVEELVSHISTQSCELEVADILQLTKIISQFRSQYYSLLPWINQKILNQISNININTLCEVLISLQDLCEVDVLQASIPQFLKKLEALSSTSLAQLVVFFHAQPNLETKTIMKELEKAIISSLLILPSDLLAQTALAFGIYEFSSEKILTAIEATLLQKITKQDASAELFANIAISLASTGMINSLPWKAFEIENNIHQFKKESLPLVAWGMAVSNFDSSIAWKAICKSISVHVPNPSIEQAELIYEAFMAAKALNLFDYTKFVTGFDQIMKSCKKHWSFKQLRLSRSILPFGRLLNHLQISFDTLVDEGFGLYPIPYLLRHRRQPTILEPLPISLRHQGSALIRGDARLRHRVWSHLGFGIVSFMDCQFDQFLSKEGSKIASPLKQSNVAQANAATRLTFREFETKSWHDVSIAAKYLQKLLKASKKEMHKE